MGEGQKTNMNRSLEEVIPILMGDFEQDFSGEGNNRCGGNSNRTRIRRGA